jgi:hypothetical protein
MTNDELMTKHEGRGKAVMSSEVETSREIACELRRGIPRLRSE